MAIPTKSKWGARLRKSKENWKQSEDAYKEAFGAENLPEDVYVVKIQDLVISENKKGQLTVSRTHVVMEGEHKGTIVRDRFNLDSEWGAVMLRRWFMMVGQEIPDDPEEIEEILANIKKSGDLYKGRLSRSGGFTNIDIISVLGEGESESDESSQEIDLESMDKDELRSLVKDNDLDIEGWRKMDEDKLREAIAEAIGGDSGSEKSEDASDGLDLDSLDKEGLLGAIEENGIDPQDLGFKNKILMKKADEKALRKALEKYSEEAGNESGSEAGSSEEDELLEQSKVFCGTWDVEIAEDADLDDIKKAISGCEFPAKELDDDEKALLEKLELTECIKDEKPAKKKVVIGKKK